MRVIWQEIVLSQTGPVTVTVLKRFLKETVEVPEQSRESQNENESGLTRCNTENNGVKHAVTLAERMLSVIRYCAATV